MLRLSVCLIPTAVLMAALLSACKVGGPSGSAPSGRRVFVTSQSYTGDLGGLAGADQKCQLAATTAGLGGTWRAWLTVLGATVSSRISETPPWSDLRGAELFASESARDNALPGFALDRDEFGRTLGDVRVWTNAWSTALPQTADCVAWTNATAGQTGAVGAPAATIPGRWAANFESLSCQTPAHLYCVEQ